MTLLIVGLVAFLGIHSVRIVAPDWRDRRIAALGENAWKGIYSVISLLSFIALIYGYGQAKEQAGNLYNALTEMYHPALVLLALAMVFLMVFNLGPGHIKNKSRHPFLLAIILWSIAHLWMNGDTASVILFGSFLVWSLVDLRSALRRPKTVVPEPMVKNDIIAVISGLAIFALFLWKLHVLLIGVPPIV